MHDHNHDGNTVQIAKFVTIDPFVLAETLNDLGRSLKKLKRYSRVRVCLPNLDNDSLEFLH